MVFFLRKKERKEGRKERKKREGPHDCGCLNSQDQSIIWSWFASRNLVALPDSEGS
jgi:hypothetical protein